MINLKEIVFKVDDDGLVTIPFLVRIRDTKSKRYKVLYKGKLYDKESDNKVIRQVTQVAEALNIKDYKKRLSYVYDKACDLLDDDFYGKNVCEFKDNKCMYARTENTSCDGCCRTRDGKRVCVYLKNHICSIRCLACKFHVCKYVRKKGLRYKVNDLLVLKYLLNWKQKIIVYLNFFKKKEETVNDLFRNSIILWAFKKDKEKFF